MTSHPAPAPALLDAQRVDEVVDAILATGVAVVDAASVRGGPDDVFWSAVGALPAGSADVPRYHVYLKTPFAEFEPTDQYFGTGPTEQGRSVAVAVAAWLGRISGCLVERGVLPSAAAAGEPAWSSNITRWDPSPAERLGHHVDWEMLTVVMSPDGALATDTGVEPAGDVAVVVAGDLLRRFSADRVPGGGHRIVAGPGRRSMQVFHLGNADVCHAHGLAHPCTGTVREVLAQRYADEVVERQIEGDRLREAATGSTPA